MAWTEAGLWRRLHRAVLDELGDRGQVLAAVDLRQRQRADDKGAR